MFSFSRNSRSQIANWWWTVDKVLLTLITVLIISGIFLNFSASPAVARRIGVDSFHFVKRQMVFIPLAIGIILYLSMQNLRFIRRTAIIGYIITMLLMVLALLWGEEIKGASRWIRIFGFSLQPSEFIKPTFAVVAAWLFAAQKKYQDIPGTLLSSILFALTLGLLLAKPDIGMSYVDTVIWGFQLFLNGLSLILVGFAILAGIAALITAYFVFPHFHTRVMQFIASDYEVSYQVKKAMEAFENGSLFGRGPGEGIVKAIAQVSRKKFGRVKVIFDVTLILTAACLSLLFFRHLNGLGIGTIISALFVGRIVNIIQKNLHILKHIKTAAYIKPKKKI